LVETDQRLEWLGGGVRGKGLRPALLEPLPVQVPKARLLDGWPERKRLQNRFQSLDDSRLSTHLPCDETCHLEKRPVVSRLDPLCPQSRTPQVLPHQGNMGFLPTFSAHRPIDRKETSQSLILGVGSIHQGAFPIPRTVG